MAARPREVLPSVYSLHTDSRLLLGSTFLRFQEHYESPSPRFRHKVFGLEESPGLKEI